MAWVWRRLWNVQRLETPQRSLILAKPAHERRVGRELARKGRLHPHEPVDHLELVLRKLDVAAAPALGHVRPRETATRLLHDLSRHVQVHEAAVEVAPAHGAHLSDAHPRVER